MSIGDRIKFFRKKKGLTQKELGLRIGFSERTADVRIAHYEMNVKTPRDKTLSAIADALGVSIDALIAPDISSSDKIMHTLFLLEDELGFFIDKEDGRYCLCLKCQHPRYDDMHELLAEWYEFYMKYQKSRFDPAEYDNWRYRYPLYNPEFKHEEDFRQFLHRTEDLTSWGINCECRQQPSEGHFIVGNWYYAKIVTASNPQEYHGEMVDEGFLVLDQDFKAHHFSMTDFSAHFKIQ